MAAGVVLVVVGARAGDGGSETQIFGVMGGFVAAVAGVVMLFGGTGDSLETGSGAVTETDTPARARLAGVLVTLGSLALPYVRLPLTPDGVERMSYSFVSVVNGLYQGSLTLQALSGDDLAGGFILLLFASVVIAGAFASILHHLGGYVVLFGAAGYGYIVGLVTEATPTEIVVSEFGVGLYVAVAGALIIVASSFMKYEAKGKDRDMYGGGR